MLYNSAHLYNKSLFTFTSVMIEFVCNKKAATQIISVNKLCIVFKFFLLKEKSYSHLSFFYNSNVTNSL
jgi:hypothetical protein